MSILKLENGKSIQLSLKYRQGTEVKSRYGNTPQVLFTLDNGDALYLPPVAADEIRSLNPDPGELFTILKTRNGSGADAYQVERVPLIFDPNTPKPPARSLENVPTSKPSLTTPQSQQLFKQLVATIEATKAAEEFSVSIGRPVKFTEADVRAMAISGFIEMSRRAA